MLSLPVSREARALLHRIGFNPSTWMRTTLTYLAVLAVFGVILPWQKGVGFLDPVILGAYACFGVVFAGPAAAHEFEGSGPTRGGAFARVLVCVLYGEVLVLGLVFVAIATIYSTRQVYVGPDLLALAMCALFGLSLSLAVSTIAVWMSLQHSQSAARGLVRVIFLLLLIGFFLYSRRLPSIAPLGTGIALAAGTLAFLRLRATLAELE